MLARAVDQEIAENDRKIARAGLLPSVGGYGTVTKNPKRSDPTGQNMDRVSVDKTYLRTSPSRSP